MKMTTHREPNHIRWMKMRGWSHAGGEWSSTTLSTDPHSCNPRSSGIRRHFFFLDFDVTWQLDKKWRENVRGTGRRGDRHVPHVVPAEQRKDVWDAEAVRPPEADGDQPKSVLKQLFLGPSSNSRSRTITKWIVLVLQPFRRSLRLTDILWRPTAAGDGSHPID